MTDSGKRTSQRRFDEFAVDSDTSDKSTPESSTPDEPVASSETDSNNEPADREGVDEPDPLETATHRSVTDRSPPKSKADGLPGISGESFNEYWFRRNAERNLEENHPERNDPSHSWPIGRFEPHQLGNCHRQWFYHWLNAPQEESDPHGIFAVGHFIEEEIVEPWLKEVFEPEYEIDNAIHVSVDLDTLSTAPGTVTPAVDTGVSVELPEGLGYNQPENQDPVLDADTACLTIAGSTDPAICDRESGEVIALTEVKSTGSLGRVTKPKRMHMMQIHAYMNALGISDGYVIYVDRNDLLNPKAFKVNFDQGVWESVVEWVESTASYAMTGTLPPADAPENWMCRYCDFRNRCGEGRSNLAEDMGPRGFVPGYNEYPRNMVEDHLEAYPDVKLTPSLAIEYPELAAEHDVAEWVCPECTASFEYTNDYFDDFKNENYATPPCPACEQVFEQVVYLKTDD